MATPDTRAGWRWQGMLSAAIRPGTPFSHLRELVKIGRDQGHPVNDLYDQAANAANLNWSLNVPSFAELERGHDGTVEQTSR